MRMIFCNFNLDAGNQAPSKLTEKWTLELLLIFIHNKSFEVFSGHCYTMQSHGNLNITSAAGLSLLTEATVKVSQIGRMIGRCHINRKDLAGFSTWTVHSVESKFRWHSSEDSKSCWVHTLLGPVLSGKLSLLCTITNCGETQGV